MYDNFMFSLEIVKYTPSLFAFFLRPCALVPAQDLFCLVNAHGTFVLLIYNLMYA